MVEREKNNQLKIFITAFVLVILAVAFLVAISDQTNNSTQKTRVYAETQGASGCWERATVGGNIVVQVNGSDPDCSFQLTNYPTGWKTEDCPLTSVVVYNNETKTTTLTLDTDYKLFASNGTIVLLNTTNTQHWLNRSNNTAYDYQYCASGYVNSAWGRSILNTNAGLWAIAILVTVLWVVYMLLGKRDDDD